MSDEYDLAVLSEITDRALATAREALLHDEQGVAVAAYVAGNEWRGTLIYGVPLHPGRRQATFRLLGRIGRACGADIAVNVLDTFVNAPGADVEPEEDPRATEALVAVLVTPEAFLQPVFVQQYNRADDGTLTFQDPQPSAFEEIGEGPVEFVLGWAKEPKKPKELGGYVYELTHNCGNLAVLAPDQDDWTKYMDKLKREDLG